MVLKLSDSSFGVEAHPTNPQETSNKPKSKRTKCIKRVVKKGSAASNRDDGERSTGIARPTPKHAYSTAPEPPLEIGY